MTTVPIQIDIYCRRETDLPVGYRVYVDSDMYTERDFVWPTHQYCIEETLLSNLERGMHSVKIETLHTNNGTITAKNLRVNNEPVQGFEFFVN